jgi:hypothetical protein
MLPNKHYEVFHKLENMCDTHRAGVCTHSCVYTRPRVREQHLLLLFKRGSAQPGCILVGLRFRSTQVPSYDFLNLYGVSNSRFCRSFFLRNGSN